MLNHEEQLNELNRLKMLFHNFKDNVVELASYVQHRSDCSVNDTEVCTCKIKAADTLCKVSYQSVLDQFEIIKKMINSV